MPNIVPSETEKAKSYRFYIFLNLYFSTSYLDICWICYFCEICTKMFCSSLLCT